MFGLSLQTLGLLPSLVALAAYATHFLGELADPLNGVELFEKQNIL